MHHLRILILVNPVGTLTDELDADEVLQILIGGDCHSHIDFRVW